MPPAKEGKEVVANKPLTGLELKQIAINKFVKLLDSDGRLLPYVAYGRCSFRVSFDMHTGNRSTISDTASKAESVPSDGPGIEAFPLAGEVEGEELKGSALDLKITSPNQERLRHEMPIPVQFKDNAGHTQERAVPYPKDDDDPQPEGDETVTDTTPAVAAEVAVHPRRRPKPSVVSHG